MDFIKKISLALNVRNPVVFLGQACSYLESRVMVFFYMIVPGSVFEKSRNDACLKILKKQSGDLDSLDMLEFLISALNNSRPESHLNVVVPNYFLDAFTISKPIVAHGAARYFPVSEIVNKADLILCNLSMLNQIPSGYAATLRDMEVVFLNNSYVILSKKKIICKKYGVSVDSDYFANIASKNKAMGGKSYIVESGFNFVVRAGTMDRGIISEVKHEYLDRLEKMGFSGKNVIDLGGHIGSFSIQITKYLQSDAKVICVEPSPCNVDIIRENVELNNLGKMVHIKQLAVSSK